ncbi:MAG TPA: phosphatidylserine decarboxylase [Woeseiaceae bacterium]|nr:phosphatidylserine decarboxylase [Woeseiaceae bacterium]
MVAAVVGLWLAYRYLGPLYMLFPAALLVLFWLVFRDPRRQIPAMPLGVVSPVDGRVTAVDLVDRGVVQGEAQRIFISIDALGTYTARCPVEGVIKDLNTLAAEKVVDYRTNALWVQTDEGDDVILQFHGYRLGFAPSAFVRYGERIGQGQRCAYLRLTRVAEVHLPIGARVLVRPGQRITAGLDVIGKLPSR